MSDKIHSDLPHNADVRVTVYFRKPNKEKPRGYISAYTTVPKRKGEDWNRGNDLTDGNYSEKTLNKIIRDLKTVFKRFEK